VAQGTAIVIAIRHRNAKPQRGPPKLEKHEDLHLVASLAGLRHQNATATVSFCRCTPPHLTGVPPSSSPCPAGPPRIAGACGEDRLPTRLSVNRSRMCPWADRVRGDRAWGTRRAPEHGPRGLFLLVGQTNSAQHWTTLSPHTVGWFLILFELV
jgi:hypothetical protein